MQILPVIGSDQVCQFQSVIDGLRDSLNQSLRGKQDVIELVLAALLAPWHILFEDLPGLGKTTLAKALAHAVGGRFARVQCTPDVLPGDITGFSVFNQKTREFEFVPVPHSVMCCWPMRSIVPRRAPKALFLKRWLNGK